MTYRNNFTVSKLSYVILSLALLTVPLRWIGALFLSVLVHECGHLLALKILHIPVFKLNVSEKGVCMITGEMLAWQEMICALAGPFAGLSLLFLGQLLPRTAFCALFHSAMNLLPVYPLDGGRFLHGAVHYFCKSDTLRICAITDRWAVIATSIVGLYFTFKLGHAVLLLLLLVRICTASNITCKEALERVQ